MLRYVQLLPLHLPILGKINLERIDIIFESKGHDGPQNVVTVDRLPLLALAFLGCLARDEADELGDAFLDGLLRVLGDLAVPRDDLLHDPAHVGYREKTVLLFIVVVVVDVVVVVVDARGLSGIVGICNIVMGIGGINVVSGVDCVGVDLRGFIFELSLSFHSLRGR